MQTTPETKRTSVDIGVVSSQKKSQKRSRVTGASLWEKEKMDYGLAEKTLEAINHSKKPWRKQAIVGLFFVMLATGLGAVTNWWIMTRIGQDSLGNLAGQLQLALGNQFNEATNAFFQPAQIFLRQGYEMAYEEGWDLTTRQGQMNMVAFRNAFLKSWLADSRCCAGIFTNMEYQGLDNETGEPNEKWGKANEDNYGNDLAQWSAVVAKPGKTLHRYGMYPGGNITNPTIQESFDPVTGKVKDPDRYPVGVIGSDRSYEGFKHYPKGNNFWRVAMQKNLQEGEFSFADLEFTSQVGITQVMGVLPIYTPSCGIEPERKTDGMCFGQKQKQVGNLVVGVHLGRLSRYLSEMDLKGGQIFFVERKTGYFAGGSNLGMTYNRTVTVNGKKKYLPAYAAEAEDEKIRDRVQWLLEKREGRTVTWADVGPGIAEAEIGSEGNQFLYVSEYKQFGLDWVIVASIPGDNVMKDIDSSKYKMLAIGMCLALLFKGIVQMIARCVARYFDRAIVLPSIKEAVEADIEKNLTARSTEIAVSDARPTLIPSIKNEADLEKSFGFGDTASTSCPVSDACHEPADDTQMRVNARGETDAITPQTDPVTPGATAALGAAGLAVIGETFI